MLYNSYKHIKFDLITSEFISYKKVYLFQIRYCNIETYDLYIHRKQTSFYKPAWLWACAEHNLSKYNFSEVQNTFKTEDT